MYTTKFTHKKRKVHKIMTNYNDFFSTHFNEDELMVTIIRADGSEEFVEKFLPPLHNIAALAESARHIYWNHMEDVCAGVAILDEDADIVNYLFIDDLRNTGLLTSSQFDAIESFYDSDDSDDSDGCIVLVADGENNPILVKMHTHNFWA